MSDIINHVCRQKANTVTEMDGLQPINRHFEDVSELSQSTKGSASSSSSTDWYEGNYSTIKCKEAVNDLQSTDAVYKTVTSTTEKGLIGKGFG